MSSNIVLFIFEGQKTEQKISDNLRNFFINEEDNSLLKASYGFNVYKLFEMLQKDEDLDVYELIVEQLEKRENKSSEDQKVIDIEDSENISDIYLFFDYDCHCTNADDDRLEEILNRFNNSQADGLLCISYPMVESIRHQKAHINSYETHPVNDLSNYKTWINQQIRDENFDIKYQNWGLYTLSVWKELIYVNLARANNLTQDTLEIPNAPIEQISIFESQKEKHIPDGEIAVLSSFPLMLHEFYGDKLASKFKDEIER